MVKVVVEEEEWFLVSSIDTGVTDELDDDV
jgi:hypothetical protein